MSSTDDPFEAGGRTVIRPASGREPEAAASGPKSAPSMQPQPAESPDSTVFDPAAGQSAPLGWGPSETVIYQGAPFAPTANDLADEAVPRPSGAVERKVAQDLLVDASARIDYTAANPLIAAAAPLLILLGNLRLIPVSIEPKALADRIANAIQEIELKIADAGIPQEDLRITKFVLCETADDMVGNLPGADRDSWREHGALARFFRTESAGTGFFLALNKLLTAPEEHLDLLELMHACLSLGFEGQYRKGDRQDGGLERVRRDVYETLRYFKNREDDAISPNWRAVSAATAKPARIPLWTIGAAAIAILTGVFFTLRTIVTNQGDALAGELLALDPSTPVTIERAGAVALTEEEPGKEAKAEASPTEATQLEHIRKALADDIESGGLRVDTKGDFIVVEINNLLLFASGEVEVKAGFDPLAGRIAAALDPQRGEIRIVGHTDNVKPRRTSAFKSNYDISVARAKAVAKLITPKLGEPSRVVVEGKGEDEPVADNATAEGRAKNRRVNVMIRREETQ